jgi:hypothetical protein
MCAFMHSHAYSLTVRPASSAIVRILFHRSGRKSDRRFFAILVTGRSEWLASGTSGSAGPAGQMVRRGAASAVARGKWRHVRIRGGAVTISPRGRACRLLPGRALPRSLAGSRRPHGVLPGGGHGRAAEMQLFALRGEPIARLTWGNAAGDRAG